MDKEKVNVIVGRFQPFTNGHIKGAEYVLDKYKVRTVFCIVETPESKLDAKHPFPSDLIIKNNQDCKGEWFAGMYPIKNADIGKIAQICRDHNFEPIMWTCGTDRVKAYKAQAVEKYINMYNLTPDFQVIEIPRGDEDISATKVRAAIKSGDKKTYEKMMPEWSREDFDSYKPFIKECKLGDYIKYSVNEANDCISTFNEGFFTNIGADPVKKTEAWIKKLFESRAHRYIMNKAKYFSNAMVVDSYMLSKGEGTKIRCVKLVGGDRESTTIKFNLDLLAIPEILEINPYNLYAFAEESGGVAEITFCELLTANYLSHKFGKAIVIKVNKKTGDILEKTNASDMISYL